MRAGCAAAPPRLLTWISQARGLLFLRPGPRLKSGSSRWRNTSSGCRGSTLGRRTSSSRPVRTPSTTRFQTLRLALHGHDAPEPERRLPRCSEDPRSSEIWRRWFWNTENRTCVFNHLEGGNYLPPEVFEYHVRQLGPPPVPVDFIPAFEEWRELVLAQQELDDGLGPASWPDLLQGWLRPAGPHGPEPAELTGKEEPDSTSTLARWLRLLYRPVLALKVTRDRSVVGVLLVFGPDQLDDPDHARVLLEEQAGALVELLSRAADAGDDVARRESLRRLSAVMHSLNGPIGRVVSALSDIDRFLAGRSDIANEIVLDHGDARERDAGAARRVELRQRRTRRASSAALVSGDRGSADQENPSEQSTLSARLQAALRNIRLLQKLSEQVRNLRGVHNQPAKAGVDLGALLTQSVFACRDQLPKLRVDDSGLRPPLWMLANEDSLRLAVDEVLTNACRELSYRRVTSPEICVLARVERDEVVLQIRDNGLPVDFRLIDNPFEEDASTYARLNLGTGFGLTFVQQIFEMHEGHCTLTENRDEQGRRQEGVTFEARVPHRPVHEWSA